MYGITLEEIQSIRKAQGGLCAICRKAPMNGKLYVDHNHTTGKVRGLLCLHCNLGLGHFNDSLIGLSAAVRYLIAHATN